MLLELKLHTEIYDAIHTLIWDKNVKNFSAMSSAEKLDFTKEYLFYIFVHDRNAITNIMDCLQTKEFELLFICGVTGKANAEMVMNVAYANVISLLTPEFDSWFERIFTSMMDYQNHMNELSYCEGY